MSKIISEEASIEKRQKKNPILFSSDKHTLPRGTNTSQILFEREKRQQQSFNKIRKQVSQSLVLPTKEVTRPRIFDDSDDDEISLEAKSEEVVELQKEYEVQWSGVAKEIPLSELVPTVPKIVKTQQEATDFTAKPKVLQFLNIKPGHHYRKELSLTNVTRRSGMILDPPKIFQKFVGKQIFCFRPFSKIFFCIMIFIKF